MRPIHVTAADAGRIEGNVLRGTRSGITAYRVVNSLLKGNDVRGITGVHGNAMTIYDRSDNLRVIGNVLQADRGLTLRDNDRLLIAFNRIRAGRFALAQWAESREGERLEIVNNTFAGPVMLRPKSAARSVFRNNILRRFAMKRGAREAIAARDHNLYGDFSYRTVTPPDFREGEVGMPLAEALADPGAVDMRPTPAGRELLAKGAPLDIAGVSVSHIGAIGMDGRLPDISAIGMPPHDPSVVAR